MSAIPQAARNLVRLRARHRCERCGSPAPNGAWHHRRRRTVVDVHQHCTCNGVWLCNTCHQTVHAHPVEAQHTGWIVSRFAAQPAVVPLLTPWGTRYHDCSGGFRFAGSGT